jgi:Cu2+-containing amine oxidase
MKPPALALPSHARSLASLPSPLLPACVSCAVAAILQPIRGLWLGRLCLVIAVGLAVMASFVDPVPAQATDIIIINNAGCQVTEEDAVGLLLHSDLYLRIDFPDSHWRFGLRNDGLKGLSLVDVAIQAAQLPSKQYIIKHAGMTEIFVPYDDGTYLSWDLSSYDRMDQIDPEDLPAQLGALVYLREPSGPYYVRDPYPKVAVECREAGIAWLCKHGDNRTRRRVYEVVVWGVYDADNYDNIIEYTFKEDGGIGFRYGATGYNLVTKSSAAHVHNGLWRVSTMLFGRTDNQVLEFQHVESPDGTSAMDSESEVVHEMSLDWDPLEFSSVIVQSTTQMNDYGHLMGYEFLPNSRTGTGRFSKRPQDKELVFQADDFVTNDNPGQDGSGSGLDNWLYTWERPDDYLLRYVDQDQVVGSSGDGIAIWYIGSAHHLPSDSDNQKGSGDRSGITLVHWSGFDMVPHNLFDYNPLGGPPRCENE